MSLEDGPNVVTRVFPYIFLIIPGHFYWFYWFYGGRGLGSVRGFRNLQVVYRLMEGWIEYLDEYNYKYL